MFASVDSESLPFLFCSFSDIFSQGDIIIGLFGFIVFGVGRREGKGDFKCACETADEF